MTTITHTQILGDLLEKVSKMTERDCIPLATKAERDVFEGNCAAFQCEGFWVFMDIQNGEVEGEDDYAIMKFKKATAADIKAHAKKEKAFKKKWAKMKKEAEEQCEYDSDY